MELSPDVELEHVHKVYSQIAPHFSDTRFKPWPRIAQFLRDQPLASLIADVGCGNGKYLGVNLSTFCIGSDICPELVSIANKRGYEVAVCNCLQLPYRSEMFDSIICIAVIHHLSTKERRVAALKEMIRVLKSGGQMLVYVWAMEQERKQFDAQDVMVPWHLQPKYIPGAGKRKDLFEHYKSKDNERVREKKRLKKAKKKQQKSQLSQASACDSIELSNTSHTEYLIGELSTLNLSDEDPIQVRNKTDDSKLPKPNSIHSTEATDDIADKTPNKDERKTTNLLQTASVNTCVGESLEDRGYQTFQRYYHVFCQGELVELLSECSNAIVLEEFYDHENWCVIAKKV